MHRNQPGIVFLDADTLGDITGFKLLERLGALTVYKSTAVDQRIIRIAENEIVITNKVIIDRDIMDACSRLKLICVAATGMNNIDLEYAASKGIAVKNVAGYSTESVVQLTFSLLFYLMGNLAYYTQYVSNGSYAASHLFTHHGRPFHELNGKIFGIIGMGTIGKRVAEVASAFGADVQYYSTSQKNLNTGYRQVPLEILLKTSHIFSIHCPLNDTTRNLIGYKQMLCMQKEAVLINAGRGGIVNEVDLAQALDEELIAGAGLDVMSQEPPEATNPLFHISHPERLAITPHIAWASMESRERLVKGITDNIAAYLNP